ncbi:hypothetical protein AOLI_G00165700 [Acnodon oligacanthus]
MHLIWADAERREAQKGPRSTLVLATRPAAVASQHGQRSEKPRSARVRHCTTICSLKSGHLAIPVDIAGHERLCDAMRKSIAAQTFTRQFEEGISE